MLSIKVSSKRANHFMNALMKCLFIRLSFQEIFLVKIQLKLFLALSLVIFQCYPLRNKSVRYVL